MPTPGLDAAHYLQLLPLTEGSGARQGHVQLSWRCWRPSKLTFTPEPISRCGGEHPHIGVLRGAPQVQDTILSSILSFQRGNDGRQEPEGLPLSHNPLEAQLETAPLLTSCCPGGHGHVTQSLPRVCLVSSRSRASLSRIISTCPCIPPRAGQRGLGGQGGTPEQEGQALLTWAPLFLLCSLLYHSESTGSCYTSFFSPPYCVR